MNDNSDIEQAGGQEGRRAIRSYVLRQGRLTPGQGNALTEHWPRLGCSTQAGLLDFATLFGNDLPVCLEIGFGMGDSLAEQARDKPDTNYVGIEVHRPGVGHVLMLSELYGLDNIRVFAEDSIEVLNTSVPDQSLSLVQVFFPDPWHKKRHHKRRLINEEFLALVRRKLASGGVVHVATDWSHYAVEIEALFATLSHFEQVTAPARPQTKFERRGLGLGHEISDLAYQLVN